MGKKPLIELYFHFLDAQLQYLAESYTALYLAVRHSIPVKFFSRCSVYGYFCTMPRKGAFQSLDVLNLSDRDPGWISRRENICRKVSVIDLKCRGFKCLVQSTFRHQTAILNNSATTEITSDPQIPRGWHLFTGLIR